MSPNVRGVVVDRLLSRFSLSPPNVFELDYEIEQTSDHVAKFQGDRPKELGDLALKKQKETAVNVRPPGTSVPGGLTSYWSVSLNVSRCG